MSGQPLLAIILMTLGLGQVLQGLANIAFGVEPENFSPPLFSPDDVIQIPVPPINGQSIVFLDRIIIKEALLASFAVALVAAVLFVIFFRYTRTGLSMRATSEDHELARSVGIKVPRVFGLSWATAGILATLGGILLATTSGISATLSLVALVAFPAILLGGLESLAGAIVGGLMIGLVQALVQASTIIEVRNSAEIAPYVLLLIVLIIRPEGLFGQKRIERI
jgi:branched-chain amino acid transport system permease protein